MVAIDVPLAAALAVALSGLALSGCQPEFDERSSRIEATRLLAIRAEPPETEPGQTVEHRALVVGPEGTRAEAPLDWAYCSIPKPVGELNDISPDCLQLSGEGIAAAGTGLTFTGPLPDNGCRQFGPEVPDSKPGEPPGRPADPDPTGGYYQPLRVLLPNGDHFLFSVEQVRLSCQLPKATREALRIFRARYQLNHNPAIDGLFVLRPDEVPVPPATAQRVVGLHVARGEKVTLRTTWASCEEHPECDTCGLPVPAVCPATCSTPSTCTGQEPYVSYDLGSRETVSRHETMRASWFASGGVFSEDRSGRDEDDVLHPFTDNVWTAPGEPGPVHLWVVLRDSRGGTSFESYEVAVD